MYYMQYEYVAYMLTYMFTYMLGTYNSLEPVQYKTSQMVMPCVGLALDWCTSPAS